MKNTNTLNKENANSLSMNNETRGNYGETLGYLTLSINPNNSYFFIYFDVKLNKVTKYEFHKGTSFFKNFNKFISNLVDLEISEVENLEGMKLYVPKNYVNKSLVSRCKTLGIDLIKYINYDKETPELLRNIKLYFKSYNLSKITDEKLSFWVNKLNCSMNQKKSIIHKGFPPQTLKPIVFKRTYTTGLKPQDKQYNEINKWKTFKAEISDLKIDGPINNLITNFWEEVVVKSLEKNSKLKVSLQLRVQFSNLEIRSLSYLDTVVLSDFDLVCKSFTYCYSEALDVYQLADFKNLIVEYKICPENYKRNISTKTFETERKKSGCTHTVMGYNVPSIMDFQKWGPSSLNVNTNTWTVLIREKIIAEIDARYNENKVNIIRKSLGGKKILLSFLDKVRHSSLNKKTRKFELFERSFKNKTIILKEGKEVLQTSDAPVDLTSTLPNPLPPQTIQPNVPSPWWETFSESIYSMLASSAIPIFVTTEPPVDGYPVEAAILQI